MIIGSGLVATAFKTPLYQLDDVWIYASGVSNSSCMDPYQFERERILLSKELRAGVKAESFVYFSTCSIQDPVAEYSPYVRHKMEMEKLVTAHPNHVIIRLPQLAGRTLNPHTLLNYLYEKITRGNHFLVWKNAFRNIIDIEDVVKIVNLLVKNPSFNQKIINVANPQSIPIYKIVTIMEKELGEKAVCEVIEYGEKYDIDTASIQPIIAMAGIVFDENYPSGVIHKYYGHK